MTMRAPLLATLASLLLTAPLAAAGEVPDNRCAVGDAWTGLNCGKVSELTVDSSCYVGFEGDKYCYVTFQGRVDAYQWAGPGEVAATLSGLCDASGFRQWSAVEGILIPFVFGPSLYCNSGNLEVEAGACRVFSATLAADFDGPLPPGDVARTASIEICA